VTQLGSDAVLGDIVANLRLSLRGFEWCLQQFRAAGLPWIALGGGGYDVANVVRAWTLAWGTMLDRELADEIPPEWIIEAATHDVTPVRLRGTGQPTISPDHVLIDLNETIEQLKTKVLKRMQA
jgi:hypothetical protein